MLQTLFFLAASSLRFRPCLSRLWREEEGQDLVEYALLMVLVALGAVAAMRELALWLQISFWKTSFTLARPREKYL